MAASAWLKRWGVPAVAGVLGVAAWCSTASTAIRSFWRVLRALGDGASRAFLVAERGVGVSAAFVVRSPEEIGDTSPPRPPGRWPTPAHALARLASPAFAAALLAGVAAFALARCAAAPARRVILRRLSRRAAREQPPSCSSVAGGAR